MKAEKKNLQTIFSLFFFLIAMVALNTLSAQTVLGKWKTIDDETNREKSIVEIYKGDDGKIYGKVVELFRLPDEDQDPICDECDEDDPRYNQRVKGMVILEGLVDDGSGKKWEDGEILDPKNGNVYSCYIELESDKKLKVRGFLGFSLLGRTQYWHRQ
jgi:uncharacterized protein (DUF2147 family)